jgi:exodeoxyribonuclease V
MVVAPEDAGDSRQSTEIKVHPYFFEGREGELQWEEIKKFQQFTFGYALTVHKAQGSQWNNVVLFDESAVFRDDRSRWLYTGLTRAAKTLTVVA